MATQSLPRTTSGAQPRGQGGPPAGTLVRWLWIWITLGILVVVVVIGFLVGIVRALQSIDSGLFEATRAVQGIGGDVDPLPGSIQLINGTLTEIDTSLKPIQGQAVEIGTGLEQITNSLQQIDASLKDTDASLVDTDASLVDTSGSLVDTSGSLVDTSGSLVDTSGTLVEVSGQTRQIRASVNDTDNVLRAVLGTAASVEVVLEEAQNLDSLGSAGIPVRVAAANDILGPAQGDTSNITDQLVLINDNLTEICESLVLRITGLVAGETDC